MTHKNCCREMKVVKCSENGGGEIFVTGEHGTEISDVPFMGKGKKTTIRFETKKYVQIFCIHIIPTYNHV